MRPIRSFRLAPLVLGLALAALALGPAALRPPVAHAATLTVCASGWRYTTIQAAIHAASTGDTISIAPGTYTENLTVGPGTAATQVWLQKGLGNGPLAGLPGGPVGAPVVIDGNQTGPVLFQIDGRTVELVDLTLRNGRSPGDRLDAIPSRRRDEILLPAPTHHYRITRDCQRESRSIMCSTSIGSATIVATPRRRRGRRSKGGPRPRATSRNGSSGSTMHSWGTADHRRSWHTAA